MAPHSFIPILSSLLLLAVAAVAAAQTNRHITSFSIANSPWLPSQNITLHTPKNSTFAAGFRSSPTNSSLYIFAVWVRAPPKTIVWSITTPISSSTPLTISPKGALSLLAPSGLNLFPPKASGPPTTTKLSLNNDGNLVFGNWSSFDSPTDTILANQPIKANGTTLTSGKFQFVNATTLMLNNSEIYWSTSPLQNLTSDGNLNVNGNNKIIMADVNKLALRRLTLDPDGNLRVYSLDSTSGSWLVVWQAILELCTIHGTCSANAICVPNGTTTTTCQCPPGYQRAAGTGSDSECERKVPYLPTSKFLRLDFVAFNGGEKIDSSPANFDSCQASCLANSSCVAFSYQFNGQRNCINRFNRLLYGSWSPASETATFIRVARSEADINKFTGMTSMIDTTCPINISLPNPPKESKTTAKNLAIIGTLFALELLAGILSFWAFLRKYSKYRDMARTFGLEFLPAGGPKRFSYTELKAATKDFSDVLGHGGFGIVYKGSLPDGRIIAVKRLKSGAGGGEAEFWAEVTIIARMHHLNLVRMWGFCAEKEQRMLVYEYIPNGSLNKFLFQQEAKGNEDQQNSDNEVLLRQTPTLDWNIRYRIAIGVARAIAYLHEECLEWVLHCDIKPENILLEDDFCPKVSDFGLSKLANKKDFVTMSRIRGTRGYLAPEWVTHREPITAKADVYSFGVVLLEIVTGTRSSNFQRASVDSEDWYFPRWAFEKVYVERRVEDMLDPVILASYDDRAHLPMVERMVKTAMWCLQDRAGSRPSMGKVAKMLEGSVEITEPEKPAIFYLGDE